jgi:DNA topoisomerase-2
MSNLATIYQKKTDKQHILDNPDTYIGSVENVEGCHWLLKDNKIVQEDMEFLPGLYKLFDEGIVNCRDHVIRMDQKIKDEPDANHHPVMNIDITIQDDGTISMYNDGNGIDVAKHPEYDLWIPEMIFGHLRTSTNYNKDEKKIVGGKNGFGFKLVLIWSSIGSIETIDHVRKLKYTQSFEDNLNVIHPPKITKCSTKPYTRITFKPDYKRFEIDGLTQHMRQLLAKRVYDISAVTRRTLKVKLNGEVLSVKTFPQYVDLYLTTSKVQDDTNPRWEYVVGLTPNDEFNQVSFVNGIYTSKGGKHVDYIIQQITKKMIAYIEKKKKILVNASSIKEQLFLFVRCDIENPAFDSQTKDYMNTPISKFGSSCVVNDKFIDKLAKLGVMDAACAIHEVKENKAAKKNDGNKTKSIRGIPKLIDANWAGTPKSSDCTIIFCEGDSAKAGIVSGLSSEDRNIIGVYPMKGKLFNVRGEPIKKIAENKEIIEIKKILGLETGKKYTAESIKKQLRYGRILFMTDQDLDGSHIKGLGINMFQSLWSDLSKIEGFMGFMNTPILKAKKGSMELLFYNDGEYNKWKAQTDTKGWKIKYYM